MKNKIIKSLFFAIIFFSFAGCDFINSITTKTLNVPIKDLTDNPEDTPEETPEDTPEENPEDKPEDKESDDSGKIENHEDSTAIKEYDDKTLIISGSIDGDTVLEIRRLIEDGTIDTLDLSQAVFISGGASYYNAESIDWVTEDNVLTGYMFYGCAKLKKVILPASVQTIGKKAFARTGLTEIEIPNNITTVQMDAFAYCNSLQTVVIGNEVTKFEQGAFYSSNVKNAYVKPGTPPSIANYHFSSKPTIYVYTEALANYQSSKWADFGTITGGLEEFYPDDMDEQTKMRVALAPFSNDSAFTELKPEYSSMSDSELTAAMQAQGISEDLINIALKIKNDNFAPYEKEFRIHSYNPYSNPGNWHNKLKSTGGSYMANPTGIYSADTSKIYVFVEDEIPEQSTLYFAGAVGNKILYNSKAGSKLAKGLNIIEGVPDSLYYVLYSVESSYPDKKISDWPQIKIHIEGGIVNGYFDITRHNDSDYLSLLENATYTLFTVKGEHSIFNFKTEAYRNRFPTSIEQSIRWYDSLTIRQLELMGLCESVANGEREGAPYYLSGGEPIFPGYYNNPNFAIQGEPTDPGWANSTSCRTSYNGEDCVAGSFNVTLPGHDDWCAAHECGHNNQKAINLEKCAEVSNNLFSNMIRLTDGTTTSGGNKISNFADEYVSRTPFFDRDIWSMTRMYYQLYLYYHQAQHNTAFYPTLFKKFRDDPMTYWVSGNSSSLKFVRKVCEVAQEDLTEFFTVWGFFEPCTVVEKEKTLVVTQEEIDECLADISKYPKKNLGILFIEDRVEKLPAIGVLTNQGGNRRNSGSDGAYGDLGQFSTYIQGHTTDADYSYVRSGLEIALTGSGGVGFLVCDKDDKIVYFANRRHFEIPEAVENTTNGNIKIYAVNADGTKLLINNTGHAEQDVTVQTAGSLSSVLADDVITAKISGPLNGTDIKYLRQLINERNLISLDLTNAQIVNGGDVYYQNDDLSVQNKDGKYVTQDNVLGFYMFAECKNLKAVKLPLSITKIEKKAFVRTSITKIIIPDSVTLLCLDSFGYCNLLETAIIGKNVTQMNQGVFYNSKLKDVYVYAKTPPTLSAYTFSSKPNIHVYPECYEAYQNSKWALTEKNSSGGVIIGDLED